MCDCDKKLPEVPEGGRMGCACVSRPVKNLTPEEVNAKLKELHDVAKPLQEWMAKNYDPMTVIVVEFDFVRVLNGDCGVPLEIED